MAKIEFNLGEEYVRKLERLAERSREVAEKALHEGAGIVADEIRANLTANLNDPSSASKNGSAIFKNPYNKPTGALADSLGITPVSMDRDGVLNVKIGFDGYDAKGVPNQLKARAMESGTSTLRKRPFVRPAVSAKKKEAEAAMKKVIDEEIEKTMKG